MAAIDIAASNTITAIPNNRNHEELTCPDCQTNAPTSTNKNNAVASVERGSSSKKKLPSNRAVTTATSDRRSRHQP